MDRIPTNLAHSNPPRFRSACDCPARSLHLKLLLPTPNCAHPFAPFASPLRPLRLKASATFAPFANPWHPLRLKASATFAPFANPWRPLRLKASATFAPFANPWRPLRLKALTTQRQREPRLPQPPTPNDHRPTTNDQRPTINP